MFVTAPLVRTVLDSMSSFCTIRLPLSRFSSTHLSETELYRIGTVAKLTGISVECLRAWERRHGLAPAEREGRTRYYSRTQLKRLEKIKALTEDGHPISSLVELSEEQLDARIGITRPRVSPHRLPQIGLVGPNLMILEQEARRFRSRRNQSTLGQRRRLRAESTPPNARNSTRSRYKFPV